MIGVIGLGVMGSHHARVYRELGVLSATCDVDEAKEGDYIQLDELFHRKDIKAVSVCVPTQFHHQVVSRCLEAGLHVLCEKPLCETVEQGRQLVELAKQRRKILAVGYIERFNPAFKALMNLAKMEQFGELTSVNIKRVGGIPRSADNVILDLMTHDFNLLIALFGRLPKNIYTHQKRKEVDKIIDSAQVLLDFGDASATCEANWISPLKIRNMEVTGTRGYCDVDMITQEFTKQSFPGEVMAISKQEPLKVELREFIQAVKTGSTSNIVDGEDGLCTLEVTLEAME